LDVVLNRGASESTVKSIYEIVGKARVEFESLANTAARTSGAAGDSIRRAGKVLDDTMQRQDLWGRTAFDYAKQRILRERLTQHAEWNSTVLRGGAVDSGRVGRALDNLTGQGDRLTELTRARIQSANELADDLLRNRTVSPSARRAADELRAFGKRLAGTTDDVDRIIGDSAALKAARQRLDAANRTQPTPFAGSAAAVGGAVGHMFGMGPTGFAMGAILDAAAPQAVTAARTGILNQAAKFLRASGDWTSAKLTQWATRANGPTTIAGIAPSSLLNATTAKLLHSSGDDMPNLYLQRVAELHREVSDRQRHSVLTAQLDNSGMGQLGAAIVQSDSARLNAGMASLPPTPPQDPLSDTPATPSNTQIARWARAQAIRESPLLAVERLADGTLTKGEVDALRLSWPKMYLQLSQQVAETLRNHPHLAYQQRVQLANLFQVPLLPSLKPAAILRYQSSHADSAEQAPPGTTPEGYRPARINPDKTGGRLTTNTERIAGRN